MKLIEHPHVLKLYDVLETNSTLYMVLENVTGGELFDYIIAKGKLGRHESLKFAAQIVMGLEHCHVGFLKEFLSFLARLSLYFLTCVLVQGA